MTKAQGKAESTPIGAEGISALRTHAVTSGKVKTSDGKVARRASSRKDKELGRVLALVSRHFDVPAQLLLHHSRCRAPIARARQVAMYLMNTSLSRTMTDIGTFFGRDRKTVTYACARVEDWRDDAAFDAELTALEGEVSTPAAVADEEVRFDG